MSVTENHLLEPLLVQNYLLTMLKAKNELFLKLRTIRSFAGVRGRVKAAVAAQPPSVSLSDALAQVRKFRKVTGTK